MSFFLSCWLHFSAANSLVRRFQINRTSFAFILMLGAFLCFSAMDTSAKWLVSIAVIPSIQVAFVRYVVHFSWTVVLYVPRDGVAVFKSAVPWQQTFRGLLLLTSTTLNFTALKYLPLTVTISIFFAAPMVVCLLSIPVLGEKVGLKRFIAVLVGFIGVLIIVQPWGEAFDYHVFYALGALCTASGYFVMTRKLAGIDRNSVSQFYTAGVATLLLAPFAISVWHWPASMTEIFVLILLGSLGMLGHTLLTRAHELAEASVLAPTVYSQIIYITIFSWLIFGSIPDLPTVVGAMIVVGSGIFIWWREKNLQPSLRAAPIRAGR